MTPGRLVISCERRLFREGLKQLLQECGMTIIGEAGSLVETRELLPTLHAKPNLVLCAPSTDLRAEYEALKQILSETGDLGIIVLSQHISREWLDLARAAGAQGFLPTDISPAALQMLLQLALLKENIFLGPSRMKEENPADAAAGRPIGQDLKAPLSAKEVEILQCLKEGMPNKTIARNLDIAEATVKVHLKSLLRKINVDNRTQAAIWALQRRPGSDRGSSISNAGTVYSFSR